jgi:hypothetical protein
MSKFLHGPPKFSRGPSVVRGPPVGDRWYWRLGGPQSSSKCHGKDKSLAPAGNRACNLVNIATEVLLTLKNVKILFAHETV